MEQQLRHYYDDQGRHQVTLAKSELPEDEICDFCCGSDRPLAIFIARPFKLGHGDFICNFSPEWDACPTCTKFIETGDWAGLLDNSMKAGVPNDRTNVAIVQNAFKKNLIGRAKFDNT
jgi:hypothetical protein